MCAFGFLVRGLPCGRALKRVQHSGPAKGFWDGEAVAMGLDSSRGWKNFPYHLNGGHGGSKLHPKRLPGTCSAGILSFPRNNSKRQSMKREYQRWYSHRLGMELGVVVYGHWGPPLLGFPTSAGDEGELEGQSMVGALADFIDAGKIKFFSVNSINGHSFYNKSAHPFHRTYVQAVFDSYLREEVVPFVWNNSSRRALPFPRWVLRLARTTPPTVCSSTPTSSNAA